MNSKVFKFLNVHICILSIICVSPVLYAIYNVPRSSGTILSTIFVFLLSLGELKNIKFKLKNLLLFLFLFLYIFIQSIFFLFDDNLLKPISSVFGIFLIFTSCYLFALKLSHFNDEEIYTCLKSILFLLIILGWVSVLFGGYLPNFGFEKYVFPFTEQSHYALTVGFLSIILGYYDKKLCLFILVNTLLQALIFPNLTFLIFFVLEFLVFYYSKNKTLFYVMFIPLAMLSIFLFQFIPQEKLFYFSDRVDFDSSSTNQTALVYAQGIDDAFRALKETKGYGLGFQMAGTDKPGDYGYAIYNIAGNFLNREDGGFLASKIITEFGVLGILFICIYLLKFSKNLSGILKVFNNKSFNFFSIAVVAFFVELFVRGTGYFSSQVVLIIVFFFLSKFRNNKQWSI